MATLPHLIATATRVIRRDDDDDDSSGNQNCVTATPGPNGHVDDLSACNAYYNFDPKFAPAVAVAVIFGLLLGVHLFQGIFYKKRYTWVLIMGAAWETTSFVLHALGAKDQQQLAYATAWQLLFLLAPLWINAFVYMTFSREAWYYLPGPEKRIRKIKVASIGKYFVWADIFTFIIQAVGGLMASPGAGVDVIKIGLNIYLAGTGLQQFFILIFLWLMIEFNRRMVSWGAAGAAFNSVGKKSWKPLHFTLYGVLACISIRIIYRIAEFAGGITPSNPIPFHEEYAYALDCFPMMVAILLLAIFHPGRFLVGPDAELPKLTRAQKKQAKAERKAAKKAGKYGYITETDGDGSEIPLSAAEDSEMAHNVPYGNSGQHSGQHGHSGQYEHSDQYEQSRV